MIEIPETKLVTNGSQLRKELQKFHLSKPRLSIDFNDNLDENEKELLDKMDKSILELIYYINNKYIWEKD